LEEAGVLTSQRGRGRGLYLRKPTPDQIRHSIASYLVGCRALGIDCWTVIEALEGQVATSSGLPGAPNPILVAILEGVRTYSRLRSRERSVNIGLRAQRGETSGRAVTAAVSARERRPAPIRPKIVPALRPLG
jgi:hypothetical protein